MSSFKKSANGLPEIEFPPLTPKQLFNRALLEDEAEKMAAPDSKISKRSAFLSVVKAILIVIFVAVPITRN